VTNPPPPGPPPGRTTDPAQVELLSSYRVWQAGLGLFAAVDAGVLVALALGAG
jgi:hypothetical protein